MKVSPLGLLSVVICHTVSYVNLPMRIVHWPSYPGFGLFDYMVEIGLSEDIDASGS